MARHARVWQSRLQPTHIGGLSPCKPTTTACADPAPLRGTVTVFRELLMKRQTKAGYETTRRVYVSNIL